MDPVERGRPCGIKLERFLDDRCALPIDDNFFRAIVVEVADGSLAGELASANFFFKTALGVLGQGIHVILALAERHIQHKLSLGSVLEPKFRELERRELSGVQRIRDASAVNTITGEAIRMPRKDS